MEAKYSIERAQPEHLHTLPEIERHAAALFEGWSVPKSVLEDSTSIEDFATAQAAGLLWVAVSPQHQPVGFALSEYTKFIGKKIATKSSLKAPRP